MNFGTWNIQGIATKQIEVFKELDRFNLDVVALTETKKKGKGIEEVQNYTHIYSGVHKENRAKKGVAIAIHKKLKRCIKTWDCYNEQLMRVDLKIKGYEVAIIAGYAPTDNAPDTEKAEFFDGLTSLLDQIGNRKEIYMLGDFNGRVGKQEGGRVVGRFGEETMNDNGERLVEICGQYDLKIWNGFFKHREVHKYTWTQSTRKLHSVIDYVIGKAKNITRVDDCRVYRGAECGSDHFLLKAKVTFPFSNLTSPNQDAANEGKAEEKHPKYKLQLLRDTSILFLYKLRLSGKLKYVEETTTESMYTRIIKAIHEAAYESLGTVEKKIIRNKTYWWNNDIEIKVKEKKRAYQKWIGTYDPEDRKDYVRISREVKKDIIKAKNEAWEQKCEEISNYIGSTRSREAWKVMKNLRTNEQNRLNLQLIPIDKWKDYYEKLLQEDRVEFKDVNRCTIEVTDSHEIEHITPEEVEKVVMSCKNGKAPGPGAVPIELIKAAPTVLFELLSTLFNLCLYGQQIPAHFKEGIISNIFKKGDRTKCTNYRGITVLSSISRIYGKVLKNRVEHEMYESEDQNGFRAGRSCIDNIFSIRQVTDKRLAHNLETHLIYIDLRKAYDSVPLSKLWSAMENQQIRKTYINAIKNLYTGNINRIKVGNLESSEFHVNKGLRQGCCMAPTLFKIYLNDALRNWKRKCHTMGIPINDDTLYTLNFADDQIIFAEDEDDACYMLRKLNEEYTKWGLQINFDKTEYMVVGGTGRDLEMEDGNVVKCCTTYKYLGACISSKGGSEEEIKQRIAKGRVATRQLHSIIWNKSITKNVKRRIYETIVESIALYGSEVWEITRKNEKKIKAMEMDFWRRSCGVTRTERIRNEYIREEMGVASVNILDTIEGKRLKWYGHLRRMPDERWPRKIFHWKPPKRKKRGRPKLTWNEGVMQAMRDRDMRDEDCQDRRRWKLGCERRHMV